MHGTDEQKERYLPPMLRGEELWCQLFSEPGHGSDLANLETRAVRDGDVFLVNGQKIWTSLARMAKFGILIARTEPDAPKYRGVSYFIIPMDLPGIEIRPIRNMTGDLDSGGGFCEVFFTDVHLPVENLIGEVNNGWSMAKETLANERVSLSKAGLTWGHGPTVNDLLDLVRKQGGVADPILRHRVVDAFIEGEILRFHHLRQISAAVNKKPGPDASLRKALCDPHGKKVYNLAKDLLGAGGMLFDGGGADWQPFESGFLFSPALTVGGGTSEVLRNVIGERLLGLPHDHDVEANLTWSEARAALSRK
jgi:alkylation response protein AidB-like acyl-CoA dehydrogenase